MVYKFRHAMHLFILTVSLAGVYQLATAARAMNVYNNSSIEINVSFTCGFFCDNGWDINPGDMDSRPGKSGNVNAESEDGSYSCNIDVDDHGWVAATGTDETSIILTSYHQDGSQNGTCTFEYQSPVGPG